MSSETGRLIWLAAHQRGVLSRAQVLSGAITVDGLRHRIRKGADSLRERTGASEPEAGSHDYVVIHRTARMPDLLTCDGPLRFAPAARAVADTVRGLSERSQVRAVVASAVQQRKCSVGEFAA
jgi:hypothetical protein